MRKHLLAALAASVSGLALGAPVAQAATNQMQTTSTVQEIVVTAEKRNEALSQVPMGVSALPGVQLEKLHQVGFIDYASSVPGLSLVTDGPGITRLTLRGLNSGGVGSTVAIYVDESPFGSSSALLNGSILTGDFDTFDLGRIEVLRGPQGTLYGAGSEGGLLKFVTVPPQLGTFSAMLQLDGETVNHGDQG
ncbi:MAG: TonB-dependent receptor plug domain-containing protein, partial [Caulobacteraceae bacterium]